MNVEPVRHSRNMPADASEHSFIDARIDLFVRILSPYPFPLRTLRGVCACSRFGSFMLERFFQRVDVFGRDRGLLLFTRNSGLGTIFAVDGADAGVVLDDFIHVRMRKGWLVRFVVPLSPVAEYIQHTIAAECLPELQRQIGRIHEGFRIIAVDVEDGNRKCLGHVRGEKRGTRIAGRRGKANLIVDDDVNGSACNVSLQTREI